MLFPPYKSLTLQTHDKDLITTHLRNTNPPSMHSDVQIFRHAFRIKFIKRPSRMRPSLATHAPFSPAQKPAAEQLFIFNF